MGLCPQYQYCTATDLSRTVLCCTTLFCTALHCGALYCTARFGKWHVALGNTAGSTVFVDGQAIVLSSVVRSAGLTRTPAAPTCSAAAFGWWLQGAICFAKLLSCAAQHSTAQHSTSRSRTAGSRLFASCEVVHTVLVDVLIK